MFTQRFSIVTKTLLSLGTSYVAYQTSTPFLTACSPSGFLGRRLQHAASGGDGQRLPVPGDPLPHAAAAQRQLTARTARARARQEGEQRRPGLVAVTGLWAVTGASWGERGGTRVITLAGATH